MFLLFLEVKSTIKDTTNHLTVPEIAIIKEEQDKRRVSASTDQYSEVYLKLHMFDIVIYIYLFD